MSPTFPVPINSSSGRNRSLSPPGKRAHEFASSDASVSRDPFRNVSRDVPAGWPSC